VIKWEGDPPPPIGARTPVVLGKVKDIPAATRAARNPKHCASRASPSQPTASTSSTGSERRAQERASACMIAGFRRPPPLTSQRSGRRGSAADAAASAVTATKVAAPSAIESDSMPLADMARVKSRRSSDFG